MAVLAILLGLMVSLSRRVRAEAATQLLRQVLVELEDALDDYIDATGRLPDVPPLHPPDQPMPADEVTLRERAAANNRRFVQLLGIGVRPRGGAAADSPTLGGLSAELFDGSILRDPWGTPIVYVAAGDPYLGFAQADRPFFLSAGPDGRFLTREDNFYSYEVLGHLEPQEPVEEQPPPQPPTPPPPPPHPTRLRLQVPRPRPTGPRANDRNGCGVSPRGVSLILCSP